MATVVGVPKEVNEQEGRVSMQPDGVAELVDHGHEVVVQAAAGEGAGFEDQGYVLCAATADRPWPKASLLWVATSSPAGRRGARPASYLPRAGPRLEQE